MGTTMCRTLESLPFVWRAVQKNLSVAQEVRQWRDDLSSHCDQKIIEHVNIQETTIGFSTRLYLFPGKDFLVIDELITNFHLPRTTLLVLISAFGGYELMKKVYAYAVQQQYHFYSFGDGMWIK